MSGDPFEEGGQPTGVPIAPSTMGLREASVQQAMSFLNDPRVKTADQAKAITFLRSKGINDDELREAFRRCAIPFPSDLAANGTVAPVPPNGFAYPPHPHVAMMHAPPFPMAHAGPPPVRTTLRPSWLSVFFGLTAAAGLYTAVREVLRNYVVPLYFPELNQNRLALEAPPQPQPQTSPPPPQQQQHRQQPSAYSHPHHRGTLTQTQRKLDTTDTHSAQTQDVQLAELRERLSELCATSHRTNERVEQLTRSITSSMALHEREVSTASELRDAIRQLSHSISVSDGTDRDPAFAKRESLRRGLGFTMEHNSGQPPTSHMSTGKSGSLAYGGLDSAADVADKVVATEGEEQTQETVDANAEQEEEEVDEFMSIQPAQVEDSWRANMPTQLNETPANSRVSMKGQTDEAVIDVGKTMASADVPEQADKSAREMGDDVDDENVENLEERANGVEATAIVNDTASANGGEKIAAARRLFESDMLTEVKLAFEGDDTAEVKSGRPLSMPLIDPPLNDTDF